MLASDRLTLHRVIHRRPLIIPPREAKPVQLKCLRLSCTAGMLPVLTLLFSQTGVKAGRAQPSVDVSALFPPVVWL